MNHWLSVEFPVKRHVPMPYIPSSDNFLAQIVQPHSTGVEVDLDMRFLEIRVIQCLEECFLDDIRLDLPAEWCVELLRLQCNFVSLGKLPMNVLIWYRDRS